MDVRQFMESEYITLDFIRNSQTRKGVILSAGTSDTYKDNTTIKVLVEIDSKKKYWRINKTSLTKLVEAYGSESEGWVGKTIKFEVGMVNNKDSVLCIPGHVLA